MKVSVSAGKVGYSGVTFPLEPCAQPCSKTLPQTHHVAPHFLFSGILIDRTHGFI
jgi:hypothetical protein